MRENLVDLGQISIRCFSLSNKSSNNQRDNLSYMDDIFLSGNRQIWNTILPFKGYKSDISKYLKDTLNFK